MNEPEKEMFLSYKEVASRLSLSVREIYRLVAAGDLPEPVKISKRTVRFLESEITAFILKLKNRRGNAQK